MKLTLDLTLALLALSLTSVGAFGGSLSQSDQNFLRVYEDIRAALATDDLGKAQQAASRLGDEGAALANSKSLDAARAAFAHLSEKAENLAHAQPGYYLIYCPMAHHDWVQTSPKIANPYFGRDMPSCGEIKDKP